jgi:hypothetical protein
MNQPIKKHLNIVVLFGMAFSLSFGATIDFKANTTGDWDEASNWNGNTLPGLSDIAAIARSPGGNGINNSIVTLDIRADIDRFIFGQGGTGSSLTVAQGGRLITRNTTDHRFGQTSAFTVNLETGGRIDVWNATITSDAGGIFNINGGDFDTKGYKAGVTSQATVNIKSATASMDVDALSTFGEHSTVNFDFNGGTSTSVWNTLDLTINTGATLNISGLSALGVGEYDLYAYTGTLTGSFTNTSISGLTAGLSGSILSDGDSVYLKVIPEPYTYTLFGGLLAMAFMIQRRWRT